MTQTPEMFASNSPQDHSNGSNSGQNWNSSPQTSTHAPVSYPSIDFFAEKPAQDVSKPSEQWKSGPPPPYADNPTPNNQPQIPKIPLSPSSSQGAPQAPISPNSQASLLEQNTHILGLMNQMQGYFTKIMTYMDTVDKRISSLETMTKNLVNTKTTESGPMLDPKELESAKKMQEQLEADIDYARKLQAQFNDEITSKKTEDKKSHDSKLSSRPSKSDQNAKMSCPVCNKMVSDIDSHLDKCLEESKKLESQKEAEKQVQPPGTIYELGKQPPTNVFPGSNSPQPPPHQPMYGYPPYYVDPQTGQVQYYVYPGSVQPPQYQPNPPK